MKVLSIEMVWIAARDLSLTTKFLSEVVGLEIAKEVPEYHWAELHAQNSKLSLGVGKVDEGSNEPIKPGQNAVIVFTIQDVQAAKIELEAKGVRFLGDIVEIPGHVKIATFLDPDGNCFQPAQRLD